MTFEHPETEAELLDQNEAIHIWRELKDLEGRPNEDVAAVLAEIQHENLTLTALRERRREAADNLLNEAILRTDSVETGRDAIVVRIDARDVTASAKSILEEEGILLGDRESVAGKLLKFRSSGQGKKEFDVQTAAYQMIQGNETLAQVPAPLGLREQHINEKVRNFVNKRGGNLGDTMELIEMDFIDGKDVATVMYEFVLAQKGFPEEMIEGMSFEEKNERVAGLLDFRIAQVRGGGDEGVRQFANLVVMNENGTKLMEFLRRTGFSLPPGFVEKVERTLQLFQEKGLYHNDMHERNVMIDASGEPYIIDFGRAVRTGSEVTTDDLAIIRRWRELSVSPEEEERRKKAAENSELAVIAQRLSHHPKWQQRLQGLKKAAIESDTAVLDRELALVRGSDQDFDTFLACIKAFVHDPDQKVVDNARAYLDNLSNKALRPYEANKVKRIRQLLEAS